MDIKILQLKEKKICNDLIESFHFYSLDDLETQDDANEGLASITECGREYRHSHVEIQDQMTTPYSTSMSGCSVVLKLHLVRIFPNSSPILRSW